MSNIRSQSPAASQPGNVDPLVDSMLDLSGYDDAQYHSPELSPSASKTPFARPLNTVQTTQASLLSTAQPLTGPSHQYDLYKQQTGIVPGALANTLQVNENNAHIGAGYQQFDIDAYFASMDDGFDFNASPSHQPTIGGSEVDMEFESPSAEQPNMFFTESTINPSAIGGQEAHGLPSPPGMVTQSNVGRMWPGMHQQAAMAKAQAQQRQQQQIIAQQQQQRASHHAKQQQQQQQQQQQRPKGAQPTDPIVEQKITQLLNSMRAKPSAPMSDSNSPLMNLPRSRKEEDDMDEDERLLASEEGKKLSSKERRQLRNKVSARAFRSRRKEYITQLESEIAGKVTENGDLRAQNRALVDENKRLSDLTRMLLSSPSFSDFLERLSSNPAQISQPAPQVEQRQAPKDVSTYGAQHIQRQQTGMTMMPEQNMDFTMLGAADADAYDYQPQVYAVLETPQPQIDACALAGKDSNFVGDSFESEDEKVDMPVIARPTVAEGTPTTPKGPETSVAIDEDFENDPDFALYHNSSAASVSAKNGAALETGAESLSQVSDLFGAVGSEKAFARYELVDATTEEEAAARSMSRFERLAANLEAVCTRLEILTADI